MVSSSTYTAKNLELERQQKQEVENTYAKIEAGTTVQGQIASQQSYITRYDQELAELRASSAPDVVKREAEQLIQYKRGMTQRRIDALKQMESSTTEEANQRLEQQRQEGLSQFGRYSSAGRAAGYSSSSGRVEVGAGDARGRVVSLSKSDEEIRAEKQGYTKSITVDTRSGLFQPVESGILTPGMQAKPSDAIKASFAEPQRPSRSAKTQSGIDEKLFGSPTFAPEPTPRAADALTPRKERAKAAQGVTEGLFASPTFVTKEQQRKADLLSNQKTGKTAFTISLTENITTERKAGPSSFAVSLSEGAPAKPRELTQEQVNMMTPEQYAVYRAEFDAYNRYVERENKRIKQQNTTQLNQYLRGLKSFIDEQKAAGVKTLVIKTDQGEKRVPIGEAYLTIQRTKDVQGIYTDTVIPAGYTVTGLTDMMFVEAKKGLVGPRVTPVFGAQRKLETLTGADLGALSPITKGIDKTFETGKPVKERSTVNQLLAGAAAPVINIGSVVYDTGRAVVREVRKPGSGFEFRGTSIEKGGNPLNLPYARTETETQPTAFGDIISGKIPDLTSPYTGGTILGDVGLAATGAVRFGRVKPKAAEKRLGEIPEEMRKPKGEKPSDLNEIYKPMMRLDKTPYQKLVQEFEGAELGREVMAKRSKEIASQGADYARLRFDVNKGKIDLEQIGVRLGSGKVSMARGEPNPRYKVSGEAPTGSQVALKEAQQKNIRENMLRREKEEMETGILSPETIKKLAPEEKKFSLVTEKEAGELQKRNIRENMLRRDRTPNLDVQAALLQRAGFAEGTQAGLGAGRPRILRQKEGNIFEAPKEGRKTYIEKVETMRKNPELEEREPFKFYIKKELGFEKVTEPIDLSGRIDLGFQKLEYRLGEGEGSVVKRGRLDLYTEKEAGELQKRNIRENMLRREKEEMETGILSPETIKKLAPEEKKFSLVTEKEAGELQKRNIRENMLRRQQPRLLEAGKLAQKPKVIKLPSRAELLTFKSTTVNLGKGKVETIKVAGVGGLGMSPIPLLGKAVADEGDVENLLAINQTDTDADPLPASVPAQMQQAQQQTPTITPQRVAAITSSQQPSVTPARISAARPLFRTTQSPASRTIPRQTPAFAPASKSKEDQRRKVIPLLVPRRAVGQPTPIPPKFPTIGTPMQPPRFPPLMPPRIPPRIPPKRPILGIPFRKKGEKKKRIEEDIKLSAKEFIGNVPVSEIIGVYKRPDIIYGEKRSSRLALKDITGSSKGRMVRGRKVTLVSKPQQFFTKSKKQSASIRRQLSSGNLKL